MDKPQSWTFLLTVNPMLIRQEDRATRSNQNSPLYLSSEDAALAFGKKMFEPPLSILKWSIVGSEKAPNFPFKNLSR